MAPKPALAVGYRLPDPAEDLHTYLASVLLAELLSDGDASRLQRSLVQSKRLVTDVSAFLGTFGDPLEERDPTRLNITAYYSDAKSTDTVLAAIDTELDRLATDGTEPRELDRVRARFASMISRELDQVVNRSLEFAKFELIFGDAATIIRLPELLSRVSDEDIRVAAGRLRPDTRAVVELLAGAAK
jgi:predicted Zn-dependent peptidase